MNVIYNYMGLFVAYIFVHPYIFFLFYENHDSILLTHEGKKSQANKHNLNDAYVGDLHAF